MAAPSRRRTKNGKHGRPEKEGKPASIHSAGILDSIHGESGSRRRCGRGLSAVAPSRPVLAAPGCPDSDAHRLFWVKERGGCCLRCGRISGGRRPRHEASVRPFSPSLASTSLCCFRLEQGNPPKHRPLPILLPGLRNCSRLDDRRHWFNPAFTSLFSCVSSPLRHGSAPFHQ